VFLDPHPAERLPHKGAATAATTAKFTNAKTTITSVTYYINSLGSHRHGCSNDHLGVV